MMYKTLSIERMHLDNYILYIRIKNKLSIILLTYVRILKSAIIKSSKYGIFVLMGIENQSDIHYAMPVKNMIEETINKNPAYKKLENDAVSAINVFTGMQLSVDKKGGKVNMCKGWDDHKKSGMDVINRLNICLANDGRTDDIIKAANDSEYQNELIQYYGLDKKKEPVEV